MKKTIDELFIWESIKKKAAGAKQEYRDKFLAGDVGPGVIMSFKGDLALTREEERFLWTLFHRKHPDQCNRDTEEFGRFYNTTVRQAIGGGEGKKRVLDLGCGPEGKAIKSLKKDHGDSIEAYGINYEITSPPDRDVTLVEDDIREMPFEDEYFDVIYEYNVMMYCMSDEETKEMLAEVMRVLKPGGTFIFGSMRMYSQADIEDMLKSLGVEYEISGRFFAFIITKKVSTTEPPAGTAKKDPPAGTTKWLKKLTPDMSTPLRSLVVSPFVEELVYRFGLPTLLWSFCGIFAAVIFNFNINYDLGTLGFYIFQAIAAIIFVLHHEKGERAPPIVISLVNIGILPLISPPLFAYLILILLSHSLVNLAFGKAKLTPEEKAERLLEKFQKDPKSLTLDALIDVIFFHYKDTKVLLKAHSCLHEYDPNEVVTKLADRATAAQNAYDFFKYASAIAPFVRSITVESPGVDLRIIEKRLIDCMERSIEFYDKNDAADDSPAELTKNLMWDSLAYISKHLKYEFQDKERTLNAILLMLANQERDLSRHFDDRDEWRIKFSRFTKFLDFLNNVLKKAKIEILLPELKNTVIRMLENRSFIEDYEIRLKLLLVLENILRIENREDLKTEKKAIKEKLRKMSHDAREEFSMRQLDNAASVMIELRWVWEALAERNGDGQFDDFIDRAIKDVWREKVFTIEQKIRFEIALRNMKAKRLALHVLALGMGKFSPADCDPHAMLKAVTGVDFHRDNVVHLRFDPNRPFTLYFEFGSEEEYQAFRREMEKTRETGSELGIYMSRYGISFGYKKDRVDPMKHEMQHAFYDAVAMTPEKHLEQIVRKLSGKADDFSRLLSDEKYQEAEAIIHTMSEILSQEMRDEFIAYLSEGGRLSGHFVFYMKSFGQYREKGVITIMSERIDAIEDEAKKVEMRNHFEKAFGSLKDPKIRGYVCNTIIEYEEIAKDFIELAGRERCIALLHLIPLNKLYRLKYLSEYYRERYTKEIGADLDKTEALIDEYMAAQKTRKGKSSSERIREVYDEFRIRREEILSRRLTGEDVREELSELEDEKSKRV
ncbi:MAG: methyltransferase domain-containing protein, partial [Candidatus Omnitrophota bacterium]